MQALGFAFEFMLNFGCHGFCYLPYKLMYTFSNDVSCCKVVNKYVYFANKNACVWP